MCPLACSRSSASQSWDFHARAYSPAQSRIHPKDPRIKAILALVTACVVHQVSFQAITLETRFLAAFGKAQRVYFRYVSVASIGFKTPYPPSWELAILLLVVPERSEFRQSRSVSLIVYIRSHRRRRQAVFRWPCGHYDAPDITEGRSRRGECGGVQNCRAASCVPANDGFSRPLPGRKRDRDLMII
jgi:hypothetical protein